jgi:drug/metabolite transporter (DMT)-like permease
MDAFAATEVRVLAGLTGFGLVVIFGRQLANIRTTLGNAFVPRQQSNPLVTRAARVALLALTVGALLGPFLGVSLGLLSAQLLPAGIASTLMSIVPVLLIPVSVVAFRERVNWVEISGTLVALVGVALLTI